MLITQIKKAFRWQSKMKTKIITAKIFGSFDDVFVKPLRVITKFTSFVCTHPPRPNYGYTACGKWLVVEQKLFVFYFKIFNAKIHL